MAYISDYSDDESDYEINTIETKLENEIIKYDYAHMRSTRIVLHGDLTSIVLTVTFCNVSVRRRVP